MPITTLIGDRFDEKPVVSANGRYVAYVAPVAFGFENDKNGVSDVLVQDLLTGQVSFVSVSSQGSVANDYSSLLDKLAISADGRFIVFESSATNLVVDDTNGESDLFMRDTIAGTTIRVSLAANGSQLPANTTESFFSPSLSADGRFVAFASRASLTDVRINDDGIFVRDVLAESTTLVSVNSSGVAANAFSTDTSISADGRFVAFQSLATNLVADDKGVDYDVFVRDRLTETTIQASVNSQGQKGSGAATNRIYDDDDSSNPAMSPNGRFVVFESGTPNLVENDTNGRVDIFMHDLQTRLTTRVSVDSNGNQGNGNSTMGENRASISADGRYIVFQSLADNLVPGDTNNALDVFVRDTVAGITSRVSVSSSGVEPVGGVFETKSFDGTISADGQRIVFMSNGKTMNADGIATSRIYLRDFGDSVPPRSTPGSTDDTRNNPLRGTAGNETLRGSKKSDILMGNNGDDILIGGGGRDILTGGAGRDRFVYRNPKDRFDRITDFTVGEDKIILSALLDRVVAGNYRGRNAFSDRLLRLVGRGQDSQINVDINGKLPGGVKPLTTLDNVSVASLKERNNFVF
jgi:RTX calcium-binding nonapeptide repeat (4 copies)/WD40-like Beta Propeller Repeat